MFAPKVVKAQAKAGERSAGPASRARSAPASPHGSRNPRLARRDVPDVGPIGLDARRAASGFERDFGNVPTAAPDGHRGLGPSKARRAGRPADEACDYRAAVGSSASVQAHERMVAWVRAGQSGGDVLAPRFAGPLGSWLGIDVSRVRIHTDSFADRAAGRFDANAFTLGGDIFFRSGKYAPHSADGLVRLAHELAHTAQQRNSGAPAPARIESLETQADERVRHGRGAVGAEVVGPTILREPTFPRRATGSAMIREVERVLTLPRNTNSTDPTTRMWSNVQSNFGAVTAGSIARRVWTNLFLRHFVEPDSRPGVESLFPRYMYSTSFGWIDAQHFFGFIDYAERHYQATGDRQRAFDASTAQGIEIERDQQRVRDHVIAGASPDPGAWRLMQVRPPNTPLFRAPQAVYGAAALAAANVVAGVSLSGTEGELFSMLNDRQRVKFWTDSAKSAFTYEDIVSDQLGTRFFFQHGIAINAVNALGPDVREIAFRSALRTFFAANGIVNDQAEVDRQAVRWGLPGVERFLTSRPSEADIRARHPSLFTLPPNP
jgi:hypothetical protein